MKILIYILSFERCVKNKQNVLDKKNLLANTLKKKPEKIVNKRRLYNSKNLPIK